MAAYDSELAGSDPALTHTLEDFIELQLSDEMTYYNTSIIEKQGNITFTDHNLIDDYMDELLSMCVSVTLTDDQMVMYRYSPDILAYDVYGSAQLDFVVLAVNDMVDPKEFFVRTIKLPYNSYLKAFLADVITANEGYIEQNRLDNGIAVY